VLKEIDRITTSRFKGIMINYVTQMSLSCNTEEQIEPIKTEALTEALPGQIGVT